MFNLFRRRKEKPGCAGGREPGSDENDKIKTCDRNTTDETSGPQQPIVALIPILIRPEGDVPAELSPSEILDRCTREPVINVSTDPRDIDSIKVLIELGFAFEILSWSDGTRCAVGWPPDYRGSREPAPNTLLMAYVLARTQLEMWDLFARGRVRGGGMLQ